MKVVHQQFNLGLFHKKNNLKIMDGIRQTARESLK